MCYNSGRDITSSYGGKPRLGGAFQEKNGRRGWASLESIAPRIVFRLVNPSLSFCRLFLIERYISGKILRKEPVLHPFEILPVRLAI